MVLYQICCKSTAFFFNYANFFCIFIEKGQKKEHQRALIIYSVLLFNVRERKGE